jgi:Zn-dependent protease with chaperone function
MKGALLSIAAFIAVLIVWQIFWRTTFYLVDLLSLPILIAVVAIAWNLIAGQVRRRREREAGIVGQFYIYENWQAGPRKAVIHRADCGFCNSGRGRAGGYDPAHAKWHGPYTSLMAAKTYSGALASVVVRSDHSCTK